jgi:ABC-type iron transport system FetAB ATPase subunit
VALLPAEAAWWYTTVGEHFNDSAPPGLSQLGFDEKVLTWKINRLSSGEKQRLSLLRVLCNHPKVLLLDEPTANLDSENSRKVENLVALIQRETEMAVIWVSHDIEQLERVSTNRFILNMEGLKSISSPT